MNRKANLLQVVSLATAMLLLTLAPLFVRAAPAAYNPNELSYGLYWFGLNKANQKFEPGVSNAYFDPAKPTVIFVHGWQPYLSYEQPDFDFNGADTAKAWIEDGWNIGLFVWNQFSDETEGVQVGDNWFSDGPPEGVADAEAKIWTPNGPKGMRWRDWDDFIDNYNDPPPEVADKSAAELFYNEYVAAMTEQTYTGDVIRIAGHSLGNQMAVRLTKLVHDGIAANDIAEHLRPTRVALLDPYWSPEARTDLTDGAAAGRKTGDVIREYVAELLPAGTLFEWYWSSDWTTAPDGDDNEALKPMMLYAEMDPQYAAINKDKHMAPRYLYFWSYEFPQSPSCAGVGDDCRLLGQMSDEQLAALMRSDYRWAQSEGQSDATPNNDVYTATQQIDAPYAMTTLQTSAPTQTVGGVITVAATVNTNTRGPAPNGVLVTFETDFGQISPRSVVSDGVAAAQITADTAGTAHISATTRGAGGQVQRTLAVTFTEFVFECTTPLTEAAIEGPVGITGSLYVDSLYAFNAVITPADATQPITYTWSPTPVNGQNHISATHQWSTPGDYTTTLTAENCGGPVDAEPRILVVAGRYTVYLPLVMK